MNQIITDVLFIKQGHLSQINYHFNTFRHHHSRKKY